MRKIIPIYALLTAFALLMSVSCNDNNSDNDEPVVVSSNTLVSAFSLAENDSVIADLDSLHFTIDVDNRLIYNADSLPKDTKINRLVANISFYDYSSTGTIRISGAETMEDTTYTYNSSANDSIDFTGNVYLTVNAADGSSREYRIQVNVHQMKADSLYWNQLARRNLPARSSELVSQKTVQKGDELFCLVEEEKGYTISTTADPASNNWEIQSVEFGFTPDIDSFTATDDALFILSDNHKLYTSGDGRTWTDTGSNYYSLIGNYNDRLLCISEDNGIYYHETYTNGNISGRTEIESDFPVSGFSQCVSLQNEWSSNNQVLFIGGTMKDGKPNGCVWGYDGNDWGKISRIPIPARTGVTLLHYVNFTGSYYDMQEYPVWLAIGGADSDGKPTDTVYISYDNGVTWSLGDDLLQLPEYINPFSKAQAFVYNSTMEETRAIHMGWEQMPSRHLPFWWTIAGENSGTRATTAVTSWKCPYIYMFGGVNANGVLMNNIWKGVINRLSFKPVV